MSDKILHLKNKYRPNCSHNKFIVDPQLSTVECGLCGEKLNPMWVLEQYAKGESRLFNQLYTLKSEIEISKSKVRCKCKHCGKITSILSDSDIVKARNVNIS